MDKGENMGAPAPHKGLTAGSNIHQVQKIGEHVTVIVGKRYKSK